VGRPSEPATEKKNRELSANAFEVIAEYRQNMAYLIISRVVDTHLQLSVCAGELVPSD